MSIQIGIQLYTVRNHATADPLKTIEKLAEYGYKGVQFAGYYGLSAKEIKRALDSCGLIAAGSHVGFDLLEKDVDSQIEYAKALGLNNITIPSLDIKKFNDKGYIEKVAEVASKVKAAGITLSYHNHYPEFDKQNGKYLLDWLYEKIPDLHVELDTYWASYAGVDPIGYMKKYAGRLYNIHIKDMKKKAEERKVNANIGEGCLDIHAYLEEANKLNAAWAFVEMDRCDGDELKCAEISSKNLKAMGYLSNSI